MLEHWGLHFDDELFDKVFNYFDISNTGTITFEDFQKTFGPIMQPMQTRYFRGESMDKKELQRTCQIQGCLRHPLGYYPLCILHMKE